MKRFQWRLQSVLDVKQKQEQLKRTELFELNDTLKTLHAQMLEQKKMLADAIDELAHEEPKQRLEKQGLFMAHVKANDDMIKKLENDIHEMTIQRDAKRNEVMELKKLTEGLDKLRSNAEREFVAEQEKLDQKASDEMTTYRFASDRISRQHEEKVKL